ELHSTCFLRADAEGAGKNSDPAFTVRHSHNGRNTGTFRQHACSSRKTQRADIKGVIFNQPCSAYSNTLPCSEMLQACLDLHPGQSLGKLRQVAGRYEQVSTTLHVGLELIADFPSSPATTSSGSRSSNHPGASLRR